MTSTLETCANTAARPASPAVGDTLYQIDTKQIITCASLSPVVWRLYDSNGTAVNDADVTGLSPHFWLRADKGIFTDSGKSSAATNGQLVYTWADQAGSSFDFVQATEGNRPQWMESTSANNKPGIVFGGDELAFTGTSSSQVGLDDYSMFMVLWIGYVTSGATSYYYKTSDNGFRVRAVSTSQPLQIVNWGTSQGNYPMGGLGGVGNDYLSSASNYYEQAQIVCFRSDSSANTHEAWINGGTANATDSGGAGSASDYHLKDGVTTDLTVGLSHPTTVGNPMTFYDLLIFDNSLSDAQMNTVLSYFGNKYGISTSTLS